jgi:hypothetical protein
VTLSADARQLFTERPDVYARFIRAVRYPQGLRAFWRASPLLHARARNTRTPAHAPALVLLGLPFVFFVFFLWIVNLFV